MPDSFRTRGPRSRASAFRFPLVTINCSCDAPPATGPPTRAKTRPLGHGPAGRQLVRTPPGSLRGGLGPWASRSEVLTRHVTGPETRRPKASPLDICPTAPWHPLKARRGVDRFLGGSEVGGSLGSVVGFWSMSARLIGMSICRDVGYREDGGKRSSGLGGRPSVLVPGESL